MKQISKITIKRIVDYETDLSYLGTFSDEKGKYAIEHKPLERGHFYKYFNANNVENMKQAKQNYNRIMKYERGNICDYGVIAEAEIKTSLSTYPKSWLINKISSGGLYGISSDSKEDYIKEEEKNQLNELKEVLKEFGFKEVDIKKAFKNIETKKN